MALLPGTNPPGSRRPMSIWRRVAPGIVRYGPAFAIQACAFYLVLVVAQIIATGRAGTPRQLEIGLALVVASLGAAEAHFRLYRRVWLVAGLSDAIALGLAVVEATCLLTLANVLIRPDLRPFPSVIPVLVSPFVLSLIAAYRFMPRIASRRSVAENRLLVVIPDQSAYRTVKSLIQSSSTMWSVIAIVSVAPIETRQTLMGIPILGDTANLEHWVRITNADGVAFVHSDVPQREFRRLVGLCLKIETPIFIVPSPDELFRSPGHSQLRQLSADDLIASPSDEMKVDSAAPAIDGKIVLVTGAAGSVGSELCRTLAALKPRRLVLVDNNESGLFDIALQLRSTSAVEIREALVSIQDREMLLTVFADERPDIVFHTAAYKHVPMLEGHPEQAFLVNVLGTKNTMWCAEAVSTRDFILISTDKAASTESVMGCTKRLCELLVLSHSGSVNSRAVRFGNVVGSRGSVIPTFERQIEQGGPVTITHPEMTRYMMTSRQAAALVISTVLLPAGNLYMLDMGEPIKIQDMANALIRARGLRPGKDIDVVTTGVRHGERLTENLLGPDEFWRPTANSAIRQVLTPKPAASADLEWTLERLTQLAHERKTTELTRALRSAVWPKRSVAEDEGIGNSVEAPSTESESV